MREETGWRLLLREFQFNPTRKKKKNKTVLLIHTQRANGQKKKVARRPWVVNNPLVEQTPRTCISICMLGCWFLSAEQPRRATVFKRGWIRGAGAAGTTVIFCKADARRLLRGRIRTGQQSAAVITMASDMLHILMFFQHFATDLCVILK